MPVAALVGVFILVVVLGMTKFMEIGLKTALHELDDRLFEGLLDILHAINTNRLQKSRASFVLFPDVRLSLVIAKPLLALDHILTAGNEVYTN